MRATLLQVFLLISSSAFKARCEEAEYCIGEYSKNHKECPLYRAKSIGCEEHTNILVTGNFTPLGSAVNTLLLTITNVFEYGTTMSDFETCVDLNDSRGYTCGLVGFTTGTGDVYTVVSKYLQINPTSELKAYYISLKEMADPRECGGPEVDFKKLIGFPEAWRRTACSDSKFRRVQETVMNEMYFEPAMKLAESLKVFSPLGKSIFYDTAVQHGYEKEDGISLRSIIKMVKAEPAKSSTEALLLKRLLHFRKKILCCSVDEIWPDSANRVSDLEFLLNSNNLKLSVPVTLPSFNDLKIYGNEVTDQPCSSSNHTVKPIKSKENPRKAVRRDERKPRKFMDNFNYITRSE